MNSLTSFGKLQVSGAASLAGTVAVTRLKTFVPAQGDRLEILTAVS